MSVEKFRELGREAYQTWRTEEAAKRRVRRAAEIVYVDREVIVQVGQEQAPEPIEIPKFLRPDPVAEFIEREQLDGETDREAEARLRLELEVLFSRGRDGALSDEDEDRKRELTKGLGRG